MGGGEADGANMRKSFFRWVHPSLYEGMSVHRMDGRLVPAVNIMLVRLAPPRWSEGQGASRKDASRKEEKKKKKGPACVQYHTK